MGGGRGFNFPLDAYSVSTCIFIKLFRSCGAVPSAQSKTHSGGFCKDPKSTLCNFSSWPSTYRKPTRSVRCITHKKQISDCWASLQGRSRPGFGLRALEGNCPLGDSLRPSLDWPNFPFPPSSWRHSPGQRWMLSSSPSPAEWSFTLQAHCAWF